MSKIGTPDRPELIGDDTTAEIRAQARHELRYLATTFPTLAVGLALLRLEPAGWSATAWSTAAAVVGTAAVLTLAFFGTGRGLRWQSRRLLTEYAVRRHADPGLGRRQAADRRAADMARMRVLGPLLLVVVLAPQLAFAHWDAPATAVPGAVLVVIGGLLLLGEALRQARAGRRWLADPPGPPRD